MSYPVYCHSQDLTARDLLKMHQFLVCPDHVTSREVTVDVTFLQPGVVVSSEAVRSRGTGLLTGLQCLVLSKQLSATGNVETLLDGNDLHWKEKHGSRTVLKTN